MSIADKLIYLNGTKEKLKDSINNIGGSITDETTFRAYATELDEIYDSLPKTTGEGSNLSLNTLKGRINVDDILGDTQQYSTNGYQLWNFENGTYSANGITAVVKDRVITLNGTASDTSFIDITLSNNVTWESGTYTIEANNSVANSNVRIRVVSTGENDTILSNVNTTQTITYNSGLSFITNRVSLRVQSGTTLTNYKFKPMLEKGSTSHTWEEFSGGQPSPNPTYPQDINVVTGTQEVVVSNKNIFVGYANMEIGWLNSSGAYPTSSSSYPNARYQLIELKPTESITISNSTSQRARVRYIDYASNTILGTVDSVGESASSYYSSTASFGSGFTNGTITAKKHIYIGILVFEDREDISQTMIELGSTATSYVEHQEQTKTLHLGDIELCKIGTYQDRIYKEKDKWYLEKNIRKLILNGSEAWNTARGTSPYVYAVAVANYMRTNEIVCMSNYFKGVANGTYGSMTNNEIKFRYYNDTNKDMYICSSDFTTLADFKTWLSTHNTIAYYVLATPTYEEITNETLLNELNELEKMYSYSGQTNISVSGNLPMILDVTALKGESE